MLYKLENTRELVSVIMPVFNAEHTLKKAIESILNQTYTNFELLIIDDHSSDSSVKIIKLFSDPRIRFYQNEVNLGSLISRNKLFDLANGKIITFQDSDDFSEPERLQRIIDYFANNLEVHLVGSNVTFLNEKQKPLLVSKKPISNDLIKATVNKTIPIVFASCAVRSELLKKVGVLREYFSDLGNYDYDWMYRIIEKYNVANIEEALYNVIIRENSNSKIIVNPKKLIGHKIVRFLALQRLENNGIDSLSGLDYSLLKQYEDQEIESYKMDKSLYLYERVEAYVSNNDYSLALKTAIRALVANPWKTRNIRTIFYVVKKMI